MNSRRLRGILSGLGICIAVIVALARPAQATSDSCQDAAALDAAIGQACQQFAVGRYGEAVELLKSVETPTAAALLWLGRAQFELRDYPGAIQTLKRGTALAPGDSELHRWLGRAYGEEADRRRSFTMAVRVRREFEEAVRLDSTNIAARRDLLEFYLQAPRILGGGDGMARRQVAEIADLDPVAGHLASAASARRHGDVSRADADYKAVLQAEPRSVEPYFEAAEFYEERQDAAGLRAATDGALRIAPADPLLLYFRGVLQVIDGAELSGAETSLNSYLAIPPRSDRPGHASTHEWLGRLYERTGPLARAVAEYRAALTLEPGRKFAKESLHRLGRLLK
jgi:tetratricopeptide (TPR) repeat protein